MYFLRILPKDSYIEEFMFLDDIGDKLETNQIDFFFLFRSILTQYLQFAVLDFTTFKLLSAICQLSIKAL